MRYIEHIVEPDQLLLSWQPPIGPNRLRRFVAALVGDGDDASLVYLVDTEDFRQAREEGFREYPGFSVETQEHKGALAAFMRRLPPRTRRDYDVFLKAIRIPESHREAISDFALLGYSGAKLPDDDFTIVNPFFSAKPPFEFLLNVQGYRYHACDNLAIGMSAAFQPEPDNEKDADAVCVMLDGAIIGYAARGLAKQMGEWMEKGYVITATIERINGTAEKPSVFLFVTVQYPASKAN